MKTIQYVDFDRICSLKLLPERISEWTYHNEKPAKKLLGIKIQSGLPSGWYHGEQCVNYYYSIYETFNSMEAPLKLIEANYPQLRYNGVKVMERTRLVIRLRNDNTFVEYFDNDENALDRIRFIQKNSNLNLQIINDNN